MGSKTVRAKILHVHHLTHNIRELTLEVLDAAPFRYKPGQAIAVSIPDPSGTSPLQRYFSLASSPEFSQHLRLLVNSHDQGKGSAFLLNQKEGGEVHVSGPFGSFILQEKPHRELTFVGTGTGIAPLWSMMSTLLNQGSSQPMRLFWGLRREVDLYYQAELKAWARKHDNFSFKITLSQPTAQWEGNIGRVTELVEHLPNAENVAAYVCGNRTMVNQVTRMLHEKGVKDIYRERYQDFS